VLYRDVLEPLVGLLGTMIQSVQLAATVALQ